MAASASDVFTLVGNPGSATTLAAPGHSIAGTTFNVVSTSNWPTTTGVIFAVDNYTLQTVNGVPNTAVRTPGTYCEFEGVVASGTQITGAVLKYGTDQNYSAGSLTRVYIPVASQWIAQLFAGLTKEHKQLDGAHGAVTADSVTVATGKVTTSTQGMLEDAGTPLSTIRSEILFDHIASGCEITGTGYGSTLGWSMTSGVAYIGGKRFTVASATGTVTATKDTYFDLLGPGTGTVATLVNTGGNIVANNAASPALASNSIRIGIVVSGANIVDVASINQGQENKILPIASSTPYAVTDSLGNLICPRDPQRRILGYRQILSNFSATGTAVNDVTGLSVPFIVPTGRRVRATHSARNMSSTAALGTAISTLINEGATIIGGSILSNVSAAGYGMAAFAQCVVTPTAGLHTYKATNQQGNAGTITTSASGGSPTFMLVELV